jgi:hypothetical protein
MPPTNDACEAEFAQERVELARSSSVVSQGLVGYRAAVSHLHDARRHARGNSAGRQVSHYHGTGGQDATIADRHARENDHPRAKPNVRADDHVLFCARLTPHRCSRLVVVVRGGHVHARPEQGVFAHDDPALGVPGPEGAMLSDV